MLILFTTVEIPWSFTISLTWCQMAVCNLYAMWFSELDIVQKQKIYLLWLLILVLRLPFFALKVHLCFCRVITQEKKFNCTKISVTLPSSPHSSRAQHTINRTELHIKTSGVVGHLTNCATSWWYPSCHKQLFWGEDMGKRGRILFFFSSFSSSTNNHANSIHCIFVIFKRYSTPCGYYYNSIAWWDCPPRGFKMQAAVCYQVPSQCSQWQFYGNWGQLQY